jgi:hypothetical protein
VRKLGKNIVKKKKILITKEIGNEEAHFIFLLEWQGLI